MDQDLTTFFMDLDDKFEEHVTYLLDKTIQVMDKMYSQRNLMQPYVTLEDIFHFFQVHDPLFQLTNHIASRKGLRYCIRAHFLRWLESGDTP